VDLSRALAEALRTLRQDAGLSQSQMAKALGVSRPTVTRLENADQNITLRTLEQLSRVLRCDPGELFKPGRLRLPGRLGAIAKPSQSKARNTRK
jgi:transcriptional regulator with XRE-family HTH domain